MLKVRHCKFPTLLLHRRLLIMKLSGVRSSL